MERIRRFFRKLGKGLKNKGYTLVEVAAVVAVTAGLTAVVVPVAVEKAKDSKLAGAKLDCIKIAEAITGFYKDTGEWPAYDTKGPKAYSILISGNDTAHNPDKISDKWGAGRVDFLENHLVVDNPGGILGQKNNYYLTIHKLQWKGPYAETLTKRDPWGNNYLVYVMAMWNPTTGSETGGKEYGWIISAGPNGVLDTVKTDSALQGDDIGVMLYAAEKGR